MKAASLLALTVAVAAQLTTAFPQSRSQNGDGGAYIPALNAPSQGRKAEHSASGKKGVVSSEVDACSNVGADILAKGGSAADAVSTWSSSREGGCPFQKAEYSKTILDTLV